MNITEQNRLAVLQAVEELNARLAGFERRLHALEQNRAHAQQTDALLRHELNVVKTQLLPLQDQVKSLGTDVAQLQE